MENIKTMSRILQMRDQMLEQEGPPSEDFFDDFGAEPRVGLLGLSGVEDEGGGRCRTLESFTPAPWNNDNYNNYINFTIRSPLLICRSNFFAILVQGKKILMCTANVSCYKILYFQDNK